MRGVSPTFLKCLARVLPESLRRVLLVAPRGVDRTFELPFALRNAIGGLDAQRAGEQAVASSAQAVGAVYTVLRAEVAKGGGEGGGGQSGGQSGGRSSAGRGARGSIRGGSISALASSAESAGAGGATAARGVRIAPGDALYGPVEGSIVARAVKEALRRPEAENTCFSVGAGRSGDWDDEFLRVVGPEIGRYETRVEVPAEWIREWAASLAAERVLLSTYTLFPLPSPAAAAACRTLSEAQSLPSGVRIHFLASGIEYVSENEEERAKGDFDGAIDVLVEAGNPSAGRGPRVRVARAESEPVWRRLTNGGRKQIAPVAKVSSEARLLERLEADLGEFR